MARILSFADIPETGRHRIYRKSVTAVGAEDAGFVRTNARGEEVNILCPSLSPEDVLLGRRPDGGAKLNRSCSDKCGCCVDPTYPQLRN